MRHVARSVPIARPVQAYAIRLTLGIASRLAVCDAARQALRALRREPARRAGARARGQDPGAQPRPGVRVGRRHPRRRAAGAAPPDSPELRGRSRRGEHRHHRRRAAREPSPPNDAAGRLRTAPMAASVRRRLPQEAGIPPRGLEARVRRAEPRRPAHAEARPRARVRRPSAVRARRRLPAHRLEGLQAAEPPAAAPVRRRAGSADLPDARRRADRWRSRRSSTWRGGSPRRSATSAWPTSIA